jgi:O-antigen ligase
MNQKRVLVLILLGLILTLLFSYIGSDKGFSYFFLGAAGLILLGLIFQRPYLGIVFMLCTLPVLIYAKLPAGLSAFTSLTSLFGLAGVVFYILRNRNFLAESRTSDRSIYVIAGLLFMVIIVGEATKPISTGITYTFTYIQLLILIWLSEQLFKTRQTIENAMKWFISANIMAVVISLNQFNAGVTYGDINRLSGLEGNANEFAIYLSVAIIMLVYFIMVANKSITRLLLLLLAMGMIVPIILSGSRGAVLFLIPVITLQLLQIRKNRIIIGIFVIMALLVAVVIITPFLPGEYIQRITNIPQDILYGSDTVGLRYGLWQYGLELWSRAPILGIGSGLFAIYSINSPVLHGTRFLPLHNTYLTQLVENGIIGLLFFLLLIVRSGINYSGVIPAAGNDLRLKGLAITWQAVMLLILFNGLKGDWNTSKLLWFCFAISMVVMSVQNKHVNNDVTPEPGNTLVITPYRIK